MSNIMLYTRYVLDHNYKRTCDITELVIVNDFMVKHCIYGKKRNS